MSVIRANSSEAVDALAAIADTTTHPVASLFLAGAVFL